MKEAVENTAIGKFIPNGPGRCVTLERGTIAVWGGVNDQKTPAVAVRMFHQSGNIDSFILSHEGAANLAVLLNEAINANKDLK